MYRYTLLCACLFVVGCSDGGSGALSASATAEASSDGSVRVRESTSAEKARLEQDIKKRDAIDKRFPPSPAPFGASSERVTEISVPGTIKLESGKSVRLDGVSCEEKAVGYLRRMLQDQDTSVVVIPSEEVATQPISAEVWQVTQLITGPAYSNVTEGAITSGWCTVEATPTSKLRERYEALADAFQHAPAAR